MFMIAVGVHIAKNMYELGILLQYEPDDAELKFKVLNFCSYGAFPVVLILEIWIATSTSKTTPSKAADLQDILFKKRTYGVLIFFYVMVSCLLTSGYIYMIRILRSLNSTVLKRQKTTIIRVFFVAILFNFLASLFYSLGLGATRFVKTTFARDYICSWTWPVFDLPVIVSIMCLHYKSSC